MRLVLGFCKLRVEIELRRAQLTGREFPTRTLSVCAAGSKFHHSSRFRKPLVSSRTVGFPESGWRPWLSSLDLPTTTEALNADSYTPLAIMVCPSARHIHNAHNLILPFLLDYINAGFAMTAASY